MGLKKTSEKYQEFVFKVGQKFAPIFGRCWWYSLFHEKNPNKSFAYHNLCSGLFEKNNFLFLPMIFFSAWDKYLRMVLRRLFFYFCKRKDRPILAKGSFAVTYFSSPFSFLSMTDHIVMPQKRDLLKIKNSNKWVVDDFIPLISLFLMPFSILWRIIYHFCFIFQLRFLVNYFFEKVFENDNRNGWELFRSEILRSFFGDVLVEGLYYDLAFRNFPKLSFIQYQYEGLAWEKALCRNVRYGGISNLNVTATQKIAVFCSGIRMYI